MAQVRKKKRKKIPPLRIVTVVLVFAVAVLLVSKLSNAAMVFNANGASSQPSMLSSEASLSPSTEPPSNKPASEPPASASSVKPLSIPEAVNSPNLILVRLKDQAVEMDKSSDERIYPASLTKIMTALIVIEQMPDLNERVLLSASLFLPLIEENASMAGFMEEEQVKAVDLLYGVMLPSGAECCIGLANRVAGSETDFVNLMNKKAVALGMTGTHFVNTTGLQDSDHYTTARDLSKLLAYALQNDIFREVFTAKKHSTAATNKHPDGITFYNTMFKGLAEVQLENGQILGGKTGFTDEAGLCLASLAEENGEEYILITAGAAGNHQTEQYHLEDAMAVYNSLYRVSEKLAN